MSVFIQMLCMYMRACCVLYAYEFFILRRGSLSCASPNMFYSRQNYDNNNNEREKTTFDRSQCGRICYFCCCYL